MNRLGVRSAVYVLAVQVYIFKATLHVNRLGVWSAVNLLTVQMYILHIHSKSTSEQTKGDASCLCAYCTNVHIQSKSILNRSQVISAMSYLCIDYKFRVVILIIVYE